MGFITLIFSVILQLILSSVYLILGILFISDLINLILFAIRKKPFYHDIIYLRSVVVDHHIIRDAYGVINLIDDNSYIIKYKDEDDKVVTVKISKERMKKLIELNRISYRFKIFRPHIYFKLV
jgi:hypothetical protein